ncbi:unnamed protein product [Musa hybrid cultivar]
MAAAISTLSILLMVWTIKAVDGAGIGISYGRAASNLPPPVQVAQFLAHSTTFDCVKLFDADPATVQAFANTDLAVDVTVPNDLVANLTDLRFAHKWVRTNIVPRVDDTNISRILVGNEVISTANRSLVSSLVPAMQNLHTVLTSLPLQHRIKVASPQSLGVLSTSNPPSTGKFREGRVAEVMRPLLSFLRATGSPFMVNAYPFFGFAVDTLDYALFRPNPGVEDQNTGLVYSNMLDGQLDAVFSAMKRLGFDDVDIVISETGWPSVGDPRELGVNVDNARDYNKNLVQHVSSGTGTPLMPNRTFEAYIFSLFEENLKPGPLSQRNFGLFHPDLLPVYDIGVLTTEMGGQATAPVQTLNPTPSDSKRWCIPKPNTDVLLLQQNVEYVCGQGIDCTPIQSGGVCYFPDTVPAHAAFLMNEYYQTFGRNAFDCDFGRTGMITAIDPTPPRTKTTGEIEPRGCDALSGSEPNIHRGTARLGGDGISGSVPDKRQPFLLSEIISGSLFYSTGGEKRPRFAARPSAATCSPKNGLRPAAAAAPRSQEECNEICFKDPVLKDHEWSYYIDRSPGHDNYSLECFRACISGCGFRFDIPKERVEEVRPKRPPKPTAVEPKPVLPHVEPNAAPDDLPSTSA